MQIRRIAIETSRAAHRQNDHGEDNSSFRHANPTTGLSHQAPLDNRSVSARSIVVTANSHIPPTKSPSSHPAAHPAAGPSHRSTQRQPAAQSASSHNHTDDNITLRAASGAGRKWDANPH